MLFQYVRACLSFVARFDINAPTRRERRRVKQLGTAPTRTPQASPRRAHPDGNRELLNLPGR